MSFKENSVCVIWMRVRALPAAYGQDVPAPALKGDSGVFELGVGFKPVADRLFL